MKSRFFAIASRAARDIGAVEVHRVAVGQDAGAPDVDQHAAGLRRRLGDGNRVVDVIRALRSRVDESGHAVREAQRRARLPRAAWVWMSIRPGTTILPRASMVSAASRRDVGLDGRDAAAGDRHVADRVEPERGIDDAPALDDQVVLVNGRWESILGCGQNS